MVGEITGKRQESVDAATVGVALSVVAAVVPAVGVGVERAEPPPGALLHPVLAATTRRQNRAVFIMPSAAVNARLEFWFRSQNLPPSFDP